MAQIAPSQIKWRWVDPGEDVEVLWTDDDGKPHRAIGRFEGLAIPDLDGGGPVDFIVDGDDGEVSVFAGDVVGITPRGSGTE
jgi:hypothetical protein